MQAIFGICSLHDTNKQRKPRIRISRKVEMSPHGGVPSFLLAFLHISAKPFRQFSIDFQASYLLHFSLTPPTDGESQTQRDEYPYIWIFLPRFRICPLERISAEQSDRHTRIGARSAQLLVRSRQDGHSLKRRLTCYSATPLQTMICQQTSVAVDCARVASAILIVCCCRVNARVAVRCIATTGAMQTSY